MIIKFDGTEYEDITFDSAEVKALEYDGQGMGAKNFSFYLYHEDDNITLSTYTRISSYEPGAIVGTEYTWDSSLTKVPLCNTDGRYGDVWNIKHFPNEYYTCENPDITAQLVDGLNNGFNNSGVFSHGAVTPLPLLAPVVSAGYRSNGELTFTVKNPNPYTVDYNMDAIVKTSTSSELVFTVSQETIEGNGQKSYTATRSGYDELYIEAVFSNPVTEAGQVTTLSYAKEEETEETAETTTAAEETEV